MKLGILISFSKNTNIEEEFEKVINMQLECCQLCCWDNTLYTYENAQKIKAAAKMTGIWK